MTDIATTLDAPSSSESAATAARRRIAAPPAWALLAGVFVLAVVVYALLALSIPVPMLFPDEQRYSQLARSLVNGHGFVWRGSGHGEHVSQNPALYVYFLAPIWWLIDNSIHARDVSKVAGAVVLSLQVVPVWLLARRVVSARLAVLPALLTVAGTGMLLSSMTVTEVLALPLTTAALCGMAMASQRPGGKAAWVALLFIGLATWARLQLVAMVPVLAATLWLDVLRCAGIRRRRLRQHRAPLAVSSLITAALVVAWRVAPHAAGQAGAVAASHPAIGDILRLSGIQALELVAVTGFAPALLALAGALSPRLWRDDRTGPLLIVFLASAAIVALESGFYLAAVPAVGHGIERYVLYPAPIALVLCTAVLAARPAVPRWLFAVTAVAALLLLALPHLQYQTAEAALWGSARRAHAVVGGSRPLAITGLAVVVVLGLWAASRRATVVGRVVAGALVVLAVLGVQSQAAWHQSQGYYGARRSTAPADLRWLDHVARGPVAVLTTGLNNPSLTYTDYYNTSITQLYVPQDPFRGPTLNGQSCVYFIADTGFVQMPMDCGPIPHRLLLPDPTTYLRFYGELRSASDPHVGRVVETEPSHLPRAQSKVVLPCPTPELPIFSSTGDVTVRPASTPRACSSTLQLELWLDHPAHIRIWFRGDGQVHHVRVGKTRYTLPPRRVTPISGDVAKGHIAITLNLDWRTSTGPKVVKATMRTRGVTSSLIY